MGFCGDGFGNDFAGTVLVIVFAYTVWALLGGGRLTLIWETVR